MENTQLTLSHSQIQLFKQCNFKWHLRYGLGYKTKSSKAQDMGTFGHSLLAIYYNEGKEALKEASKKHIMSSMNTPQFSDVVKVVRIVERYVDEFAYAADQGIKTIATELYFNVEFVTPAGRTFNFQGYVDWVFSKGNKIGIYDHKFHDSNWWTETQVAMDSQLTTYAAILPLANVGIDNVDMVGINMLNKYPYKDFEKRPVTDIARRVTSYRSKNEKASVLYEVGLAADELLSALETKKPFAKVLNKDCARCDFSEQCMYALKGVDIIPFLDQSFEKKES